MDAALGGPNAIFQTGAFLFVCHCMRQIILNSLPQLIVTKRFGRTHVAGCENVRFQRVPTKSCLQEIFGAEVRKGCCNVIARAVVPASCTCCGVGVCASRFNLHLPWEIVRLIHAFAGSFLFYGKPTSPLPRKSHYTFCRCHPRWLFFRFGACLCIGVYIFFVLIL